jgi:hypothetical protein
MIFRGLDLLLQLPSHDRRRVASSDPEHAWGGGISSPTEGRQNADFETRRIVFIVVICLAVVFFMLVRIILPLL